jgi:heme-degrading monooxygenase HmoA
MTVAVIFTSRRTAGSDAEYAALSTRMEELAREQPGFLDMISVRDPKTRVGVTVSYFEDEQSVRAWKAHPEHLEAQRKGMADLYEEYHVTVADVRRDYASAPRGEENP